MIENQRLNLRKIAIIGAGPSGLAAAKYLVAENYFSSIVVFEQRSVTGGLWNFTPQALGRPDNDLKVSQIKPRNEAESPVWNSSPREAIFVSPLYDQLETNIPWPLMRYSDFDPPTFDDIQLFPDHRTVKEYIEAYAEDVKHLINFHTQVQDVRLVCTAGQTADGLKGEKWKITSKNLLTDQMNEDTYDAVIVANGHHAVPYIPDIEGVQEWNDSIPGSISHSKFYRSPEEYHAKKVMIVGNSVSGFEISCQLLAHASHPILMSQRSISLMDKFGPFEFLRQLPPISRVDHKKRTVYFEDGQSHSGVDCILFCTGYLYSFPFLSSLDPPLIDDGSHLLNTYKHLFYASHFTLTFLSIPQRIIPFRVAEAQAAVLARVYSGRLALPHVISDKNDEPGSAMDHESSSSSRHFHTLDFPKDADYVNELLDWAAAAEPRHGLECDGRGKMATRWGAWEYWVREILPIVKKAFVDKGESKKNVKVLSDLGFIFEKEQL